MDTPGPARILVCGAWAPRARHAYRYPGTPGPARGTRVPVCGAWVKDVVWFLTIECVKDVVWFLTIECVLLTQNVFSHCRMSSLTVQVLSDEKMCSLTLQELV